jgi:hypothetical protein
MTVGGLLSGPDKKELGNGQVDSVRLCRFGAAETPWTAVNGLIGCTVGVRLLQARLVQGSFFSYGGIAAIYHGIGAELR